MQTITLTKDSFEALIGFAYLDGKLHQIGGDKIKASDYAKQFLEDNATFLNIDSMTIKMHEEAKKIRQERDSLNTIKEEI